MFIGNTFFLVVATVPSFLFITGLTHPDYRWCLYKFYVENRSWFEAKAICEEGNMTLAHITAASNHTYLYNLMKSSLPALFANPPSSVWVGAYRVNGGEVKWQDDCMEVDASFFGGGHDSSEVCFVLADSNTLNTGSCSTRLPFLCQTSSLDLNECFTSTSEIPYASTASPARTLLKTALSDCYPDCADCVGIRYNSPACVFLMSANRKYTKGPLYIRDLLRTSVTADVTASISDLQNICSSSVTTQYYETSNHLASDIATTMAFSGTATTPTTATSTLMGSIGLESSNSEPMTVTELTSESTPPLSNVLTSVSLETTSLPTETETLSMTCSHCACTKSSSIDQEELEESISKLKEQLRVNPKELSSFKRTLTSAPDDRQSAANIGYMGALILCIIPGLIILLDAGRLTREFKQFISHLRNSHRATANVTPLKRT